MIIKIVKSEKQTFEYAKDFAKKLKFGQIIALTGQLGAGKTVFVKGLAQGLGIKGPVRSPSFLIMRVYNINKTRKFCHIDAYRLQTAADLENIGALDYLDDKNTISVIEWAEKIKDLLKHRKIINIKIEIVDKDIRKIVIK